MGWLQLHLRDPGPTGVRGFHRCDRLIAELVPYGHDADVIRREVKYLVKSQCVMNEQQRTDEVTDDGLISLSTAGYAHLSLISNVDYLAACSEDAWLSDEELAQAIADKIGRHGPKVHYSRVTTRHNARAFAEYLLQRCSEAALNPDIYLNENGLDVEAVVKGIHAKVIKHTERERADERWPEVEDKLAVGEVYDGVVDGVKEFGVFVSLPGPSVGLLHISELPNGLTPGNFHRGNKIRVKVLSIDVSLRRIALAFERDSH